MPTIDKDIFTAELAVIGGSGFYSLSESAESVLSSIGTPYSEELVTLYAEEQPTVSTNSLVWFLPRHGKTHTIPPHLINYRANLWALKQAGVKKIIAVNAVGGITEQMKPGTLVLPEQIIDYTWGREHTYFDGMSSLDNHIDFTYPYDQRLNSILAETAATLDIKLLTGAVYACTQGPRLESCAEIIKLRRDGADVVGMTGMPEAALARELGIDYASITIVVNWGAGVTEGEISMKEIVARLDSGTKDVRKIILASIDKI